MVFKLQPHIVINDRSTCPTAGGDFGTPEQRFIPEQRLWELNDTIGYYWGYTPNDRRRRTAHEFVIQLIMCVANGGNMLLNIGPKPDGTVQPRQARVMEGIGRWMRAHGEAIYGCGRSAVNYPQAPWIATAKGDAHYLHLINYPGERFAVANLHDLRFTSARLLGSSRKLTIMHEPTRDVISGLPAKAPDPIAPVVKLAARPKTAAEKQEQAWIGLDDPERVFDTRP
jgi:alpha-L-fucosidase